MIELEKKLNKYIKLTELALEEIKVNNKDGEELLKISKCYFDDAKFFREKKDFVNAFSAINYSHAFLDAGVILKKFKVRNKKLFMID